MLKRAADDLLVGADVAGRSLAASRFQKVQRDLDPAMDAARPVRPFGEGNDGKDGSRGRRFTGFFLVLFFFLVFRFFFRLVVKAVLEPFYAGGFGLGRRRGEKFSKGQREKLRRVGERGERSVKNQDQSGDEDRA